MLMVAENSEELTKVGDWFRKNRVDARRATLDEAIVSLQTRGPCPLIVHPGLDELILALQHLEQRIRLVFVEPLGGSDLASDQNGHRQLERRAWVTRIGWPESSSLLKRWIHEESLERLKLDALACIAHEMATPVANIRGWCELLESTAGSEPQAFTRHASAVIGRAADQLRRLTQDLREIENQGADFATALEAVDLNQMVARATDTFQLYANKAGVTLEFTTLSRAAIIQADELRLLQVLGNLLHNSIKFTPRGGRVELHLSEDERHYILQVLDTGVGIAPERAAHVFDRLWRGSSEGDGRGLGLTIARTIVQAHGGRITVHSDGEMQGTTFRIALPKTDAER